MNNSCNSYEKQTKSNKVTNTPVVNRGNAKTAIPNKGAKAPRPIFPYLDDFVVLIV